MSAADPLSRRAQTCAVGSAGGPGGVGGLARWAVGLGRVVVAVLVVSYAIFGVARVVGGEDAISDTLVGALAGVALLVGMLASLVAFVMAIVAGMKHQRWALLWLPLSVFPALLVGVALIEALWME